LPDPDGPQMTTTSPLSIEAVHRFNTWLLPYHLLTWSNAIMVFLQKWGCERSDTSNERNATLVAVPLQSANEVRKTKTDNQIDQSNKQIGDDKITIPLTDASCGTQEVRARNDIHQRGILKQHDYLC